jgi:hypothetical protein
MIRLETGQRDINFLAKKYVSRTILYLEVAAPIKRESVLGDAHGVNI